FNIEDMVFRLLLLLSYTAIISMSCSGDKRNFNKEEMDIHLKQSLSESMKSALNNSFDDNFDNLIVSVLNTQECYSCSLQRVEIWKAYKQVLSELKTRKILIIDKKDKDLIALSSLGLGFSI